MANPCLDFLLPEDGCQVLPTEGGIYQIWITETENINGITVTATTGAIDAETEGAVTAISRVTGTKFLKLNPIAGSVVLTQPYENRAFSQTLTFDLNSLSQVVRETIKKLASCACDITAIVFYNGDKRPDIMYGKAVDDFGNIRNNSPLRLTNATFNSGQATTDNPVVNVTLARENGNLEQLSRHLNMSVSDIQDLLTPAP